MILEARIPWPGESVGCFDPARILDKLREAFGDKLECDEGDLFEGHYERVRKRVAPLGLQESSPVLRSAARKVRELAPRYRFQLLTPEGTTVVGTVDRYSISADFSMGTDEQRRQFHAFLSRLALGQIIVTPTSDD